MSEASPAMPAPVYAAGPIRRFFRALLGIDFPEPVVGQVWRSEFSGRLFRVARVTVSDWRGTVSVAVAHEFDADGGSVWSPVLCTYADSLSEWRANLCMERRALVAIKEGGHA